MGQFTETEIKLLNQLFGKGALDALKALLWTTIPEGLDTDTVSRYMQLARSMFMNGNDPTGTQFLRWLVLAKTSLEMSINTALGASLTSYLASALIAGAIALAGAAVLVATLASPLSEPPPPRGDNEQVSTATEWVGTIEIKRTMFGASKCSTPPPDDARYFTCNLNPVAGKCWGTWSYCGGLDWVPLEPMTYSGPVRVDLSQIPTPYKIRGWVTFLDAGARLQGPLAAQEPDSEVNLDTDSILDVDTGEKCDRRLVTSSCRVTINDSYDQGGNHHYTEIESSVQFTGSTFRREVKMTVVDGTLYGAPAISWITNEVISVQAGGGRK